MHGESFLLQAIEKKGIDRVRRPRRCRDGGPLRGEEGPVPLIGGSLLNPAAEDLLLLVRENFSAFVRRHEVGVGRIEKDAGDDLALGRLAGGDGSRPGLCRTKGGLGQIETKSGFSVFLVGTVALETGVGEDGTNVPVEHQIPRGRRKFGEDKPA